MRGFLSYDSPLMSGIYKIIYCIYLCLLWILCCIPIFTIGASTTALYYTLEKVIKHERGYVGKEFFRCFKESFKQATIVWLGMVVVAIIFVADIQILKFLVENGNSMGNAYVLFEVFLFMELIYAIYVFAYLARFRDTIKRSLKNAGFLAIRHLGTTMMIVLIILFGSLVIYLIPITILLMPAVIVWFISVLLERLFYRYMSDEDKKLENKRNMVVDD